MAVDPTNPSSDAAALVRALSRGGLAEAWLPRLRVTISNAATAAQGGPRSDRADGAAMDEMRGGRLTESHAVNEVLIAEAEPARPLDLEISVDGGPWSAWRSSGTIISARKRCERPSTIRSTLPPPSATRHTGARADASGSVDALTGVCPLCVC